MATRRVRQLGRALIVVLLLSAVAAVLWIYHGDLVWKPAAPATEGEDPSASL
jgi:hypothetical protein